MTTPEPTEIPAVLSKKGVGIIGTGLMGAAYATRLSARGVPFTLTNRDRAKAIAAAEGKRGAIVADSLADCVAARDVLLVACSPTVEAITAICDPLVKKGRAVGVTTPIPTPASAMGRLCTSGGSPRPGTGQ